MEINLSWDLFVIVFFSVIIAYTFIIGRNQSVKIIISSYIAILAADGIGNLVERYFLGDEPTIKAIALGPDNASALMLIKILIFIATIVLITTRGKFNINMSRSKSFMMNLILSMAYGILSAGLITSTILIYASGASLVQTGVVMNDAVLDIYRNSQMVRLMINNYNVWFSLPAIAFVFSSFFGDDES
jgi:hypothetical protein